MTKYEYKHHIEIRISEVIDRDAIINLLSSLSSELNNKFEFTVRFNSGAGIFVKPRPSIFSFVKKQNDKEKERLR
jgi:hypothetical protein